MSHGVKTLNLNTKFLTHKLKEEAACLLRSSEEVLLCGGENVLSFVKMVPVNKCSDKE